MLSNQVYESIVDQKGYIWICSDAGIQKYNGSKFTNFNEENGLFDAVILSIYEDFEGKIWFNTINHRIGYIENNNVHYLKLKLPRYKLPNYYNTFSIDKKKTLWIGSLGKGLILSSKFPYKTFKIHHRNENFCKIIDEKQFVYAFNDNPTEYGKTNFWKIQTNHSNSKVKLYKKCLSKNRLFSTDIDGNYVIYDSNELILFQKNKQVKRIKNCPRIFFLRIIGNKIFVGYENQGLKIYTWKNNQLTVMKHFLKKESVTSICYDKQGGTWISTLQNGLFYQPSSKISTFKQNNRVESFLIISKDSLLFFDKTGKSLNYDHLNYKNGCPPKIHPYKKNTIAICGNGAGYFNIENHQYEKITDNNRPVFFNDFIFLDNHVFASSRYSFIEVINNKTLKRIFNNKLIINSISKDAKDKGFWICQNGKITKIDRNLKIIKTLKNFTKKEIKTNNVVSDKFGNIWVSTNGEGLICFDRKFKKRTYLKTNGNGFCNELKINNEYLIVNSRKGIFCINTRTKKTKSIPFLNKKIGKEIKQLEIYNDNLYILSSRAFLVVSMDLFKNENTPNEISIGKTRYYSKLKNNNPSLLKNNNNLTIIKLENVDFNKFENEVYDYRLLPIQANWTRTTDQTIRFTDLPEDDYIFEVKNKSNKIKRKFFHIDQPFYQSYSFVVVSLIFLTSIILSVLWYILNKQLKKIIEKKNVQILISELEATALRAQMNPHFIFNCLNSIQNFLYTDKSEKAIEFLGKFSVLIRKVLDQSCSELTTIENEFEILKLYIELEQLRQNGKFIFNFEISDEILISNDKIPTMLIQPFVENSILHGLSPLKDKSGKLNISISKTNDSYVCKIEDNGVGRTFNKTSKKHNSMGIKITEERIQNISKIHGKEAKFTIIDNFDENGNASGTKVILTIPNI